MRRVCIAAVAGVALSGCATVSFAPPAVPIAYAGDSSGSQTCTQQKTGRTTTVSRDVQGAWTVIDAFMAAYSCSHDTAANGRQIFDLPAFVSTTAAATAVAVGATPVATIGIAGTAGSSTFNAGKAYYDPTAKAAIYNQALAALECIRDASIGITSTAIQQSDQKKALLSRALIGTGQSSPTVTITADEQYFMIVTTAVYEVRDILAGRLSTVGTINASTVADEIKKAADDAKAKQDAADQKAGQNPPPTSQELALFTVQPNRALNLSPEAAAGLTLARIEQSRQDEVINLDLQALQPKLDVCVATAKL